MDNRKYNIYFNTHTVSGIIICAVLYVMFFAGSFSFFKDEITAWQNNDSYVSRGAPELDIKHLLDSLSGHHVLTGRDFDFTLQRHYSGVYVAMSASHDTIIKKQTAEKKLQAEAKKKDTQGKRRNRGRGGDDDSAFFTYDLRNLKETDYASSYTMGEFLYRLHFLAQLNQVFPFRIGVPFGYLLAGVVSFIFLFALITGLLLHWNKIASNFFTFRPWGKWKSIWTDLHTVLGVIGFPFQLVFALTGIILIFNSFLIIPYTSIFYKGDSESLFKDLEFGIKARYEYSYQTLNTPFDINDLVQQTQNKWKNSDISTLSIRNYGDENMHVIIQAKPHTDVQMNGLGELTYRVRDHKIIAERAPDASPSYVSTLKGSIYHLHFGDFGGRPVRVMYFVLGLLGCVVINSGVMIWLVARDKKSVPQAKRKFNFWTANVYIASSMSMLPVTAFTMIALLFLQKPGQSEIYHWYFYTWLALSVYFLARRDLALVNRQSTLLSAVLCLLLPIMDGVKRNNWLWTTYSAGAFDILFIDLLFLILSIVSGIIYWKMLQKRRTKQVPPAPGVVNNKIFENP